MNKLINRVAHFGHWVSNLPDQIRLRLVLVILALLAGGAFYKLVVSYQKLGQPTAPASTEEMIKPMQSIFKASHSLNDSLSRSHRQQGLKKLDSLANTYIKD